MIDQMMDRLKQEKTQDGYKKENCKTMLDHLEDAKKELGQAISHSEAGIADASNFVKTVEAEISTLVAGIKELDQSVAEASAQRKGEHSAYVELMAETTAASKLLGLAKTRLKKFYSSQPETAPSLMSVAVHMHQQVAPETPRTHEKKMEESNGVIAHLDRLKNDLDQKMRIAETEEKNAQIDYEKTIEDATAQRAEEVKTLGHKEGIKADAHAAMSERQEELESQHGEMAATLKVVQGVHDDCDWLLQNFDVRKDAHDEEIDSLNKAKAVLSGADYAFLQQRSLRTRQ